MKIEMLSDHLSLAFEVFSDWLHLLKTM